ncbi:triple tyrosine motif-containing protein [Bacillus alkalicellulosilyticus]|uniref:triple tyrosine motif-containing protein n=1 Tax=Alkalihalobacterium alkalicellulosilyticum TaxID=1912214 RepID=UPI0009986712|nr:triple tyrosine motif-containing protein [Bacillus alkalicellulosilyticus]
MKKIAIILFLLVSYFIGAGFSEANSTGQLLIINKTNNQMAFYSDGKLVRTFNVATGREAGFTPEGTFKVVNKIKNRPYYKENIAGGDPKNPLGDRWLGINARGTYGTTYAIHGNNNPSSIGTYASAGCIRMYNEEVRWLYDQVALHTPVVILHSKQSFDTIATNHGYGLKSKIGSVTVNKTSPQPTNTSVTITAKTVSGINTRYKYLIYDGGKWKTLSNFTSKNQITWKPQKAGSYKIKVQVKNKNGSGVEDEKVISYKVFKPASISSVSVNKSSPQVTNTSVTVSAKSNDNKNNRFKFSIYDGNKWKTIQKYSEVSKITWKPTKAGTYKIKVEAKHKSSAKKADHEKIITFKVYNPATVSSLKTNKKGPQPTQTTIQIEANSNDNANNSFKFMVHNGEKWKTIQDYSKSKMVNWTPSSPGNYKVKVLVKHKYSTKKHDSVKEINYTIFAPATIQEITTDKSSPQTANSEITINALSNDKKNHLYKFSIYDGHGWVTLQDYSSKSSLVWTPSNHGTFKIKVDVKHKHSKKKADDSKELPFVIHQSVSILGITQNTRDE